MATIIWNMGEFRPKENLSWEVYTERLALYMQANGISTAEKKVAVLLSACGNETYEIARSLFSPALPSSKSYQEIIEALTNYFSPKPSEIVQ